MTHAIPPGKPANGWDIDDSEFAWDVFWQSGRRAAAYAPVLDEEENPTIPQQQVFYSRSYVPVGHVGNN